MALREEELTGLCDDVDLDRDRALVERCQAGDSAAFGNLYARYYERLLRFCLRRLNDRHEAEDAAQEAFARAWKALPRFAGERRFYPWLTVIAGNICTDMLRRRSRSTPTDDLELTAQHPVGVVGEDTSEELVLAAVDGELVNRALDRLSTRHRHVLAMREGSGWTYQQIADHEGVEIGTIETLLWRARQALEARVRRRLRVEGGLGRLPHRHRRAHPPHRLPCRAPRRQRAPQQWRQRLRGDAQRGGRRRRHRGCRRRRLHCAARALEWPERGRVGPRLCAGGTATGAGCRPITERGRRRRVGRPGTRRWWSQRAGRWRRDHGDRRRDIGGQRRPAPRAPKARAAPARSSAVGGALGGASSGANTGLAGGLNQAGGGTEQHRERRQRWSEPDGQPARRAASARP